MPPRPLTMLVFVLHLFLYLSSLTLVRAEDQSRYPTGTSHPGGSSDICGEIHSTLRLPQPGHKGKSVSFGTIGGPSYSLFFSRSDDLPFRSVCRCLRVYWCLARLRLQGPHLLCRFEPSRSFKCSRRVERPPEKREEHPSLSIPRQRHAKM